MASDEWETMPILGVKSEAPAVPDQGPGTPEAPARSESDQTVPEPEGVSGDGEEASSPVGQDSAATVDHAASSHDWVVRTPEGDQMRAATRITNSWPLLRMYAIRQVNLRYRQSALGLSWTLVQPIAIMAIYGFIFTRFFQVGGGAFPYLSMAWTGLTIWSFVQVTIQMGALSLLNDAYMLSRVWFPREIIPLAPVLGGLVDLGAAALILIPIVILQGVGFSIQAVAMVPILVVLIVWVAAISVITSTITIFFRDMATIVALGLRLLFIATPVMYEASAVPVQYGWVLAINPFAVVVNNSRTVLLAHVWPNWELLALHGALGAFFFFIGLKYLRSVERRMVDIV